MKIGIDIQDTEPMKRMIGTERLKRIFTAGELEYMRRKNFALETVTGIYCAKEAFFKAIGQGILIAEFLQIEIKHNALGVPYYSLSDAVIGKNGLKDANITLSISHTKAVAVAVCVITPAAIV